MVGTYCGHTKIVEELLKGGADVEIAEPVSIENNFSFVLQ